LSGKQDIHNLAHTHTLSERILSLLQVIASIVFTHVIYFFLCSNSPFWYCDAGMNFVVGPGWRDQWDVVITSAGKPDFYTENNRPFREVDIVTGKAKFKQVRLMQKK